MSLCLTITSYHKITPGQCPEKSMDKGVMAIGRSSENDWVLPDPERLVSSRHCVIQYKDGRYYLTDNSTNGVELVNAGIRLRRGNSEPLQDGEVIRIGEYEIRARIDFNLQLADIALSGVDASNSFEALMGRAAPAPIPSPVSTPAVHFQGGSAMDTLPDLFDFLTPTSVPPATQPDHVPAQQHDFRPPTPLSPPVPVIAPVAAAAAGVIPQDWDLLGDTPKVAVNPPTPAPVAIPAIVEPVPAPPAAVIEPPVAPVVPVADSPAVTGSRAALLQAFLRGAGLDQLRIDGAQVEAQMEAVGRSYRLMVEGLIDVLRARSSLKGEFRMQQTMIRPVENNPLKFAPNADEALLLLLRHGNQAFMAPDQAVRDSFDDLRAHQLAVMAGVEAAIKHLLKRFEPAELEARMSRPGGLSNLFSGSRQAQYWQQFTELYTNISREAEEDFQDLFGREFSRAYEEHSARLRKG
ncbi:type VI secretion system-associated FHA domain protein TagH [Pseudomonas gingeri]|uniref:Type VI secretion system-associated FHA domain protein TagH n=1 Tax=Pseudomonas gingeri TaxID=117681 RepID=A0A7Y7YF39_9PSED|nr:type VI secretion system-associated FHA domain protein TagH [Pseudomonas gingeri]NWA04924.1 type VI secretion system-associated FHA domain protein TagH [Pseudomonas gingeri]NWA17454.1 type VI secretion system-associated FHA domain protein TagH [Pseudomonas gingeri]NWA58707.1 type VI secretion system-associated FHA domain protein TagH [Pseudomonas gingeri]NWA96986.1 type VI secretion system-associated FHA domain protein TagH [Pseudomonas gingeri]NWB05482.1 type VI secretion system-associated